MIITNDYQNKTATVKCSEVCKLLQITADKKTPNKPFQEPVHNAHSTLLHYGMEPNRRHILLLKQLKDYSSGIHKCSILKICHDTHFIYSD